MHPVWEVVQKRDEESWGKLEFWCMLEKCSKIIGLVQTYDWRGRWTQDGEAKREKRNR